MLKLLSAINSLILLVSGIIESIKKEIIKRKIAEEIKPIKDLENKHELTDEDIAAAAHKLYERSKGKSSSR